jgi:hypothetical protein
LVRQSQDDGFGSMLSRIRRGELTTDDFEKLSARHIHHLSEDELEKFASLETTFLFPERKQCLRYNNFRVKHLGKPVIKVFPIDAKTCPKEITERDVLLLAEGCKVILNYNLAPQVRSFTFHLIL